ncbi:MAG: hypothetical protein HY403_08960 [Elusimicrobia bacterium]|nr:hypothetical protein [Elusimicrobiota bacterium]
MRPPGYGAMLAAALVMAPARALASDAGSLQFTVPAPDPAQAGDVVSLQALAVNTGTSQWDPGTYYWVGEVYDLEYRLIARTEQVSPREAVAAGAVSAISLPFHIPDTMSGRRLYRVFLVKGNKTLLESDYKGFQIVEKPIPPPPDVVTYHMEGNLTTSLRSSSYAGWKRVSGATTFNTVGKINNNSYLINLYLLHTPGNVFDPFIIVGNFYAPWGTIYGGDISPNLGPLAVSGQGMRGVMLEQKKGIWDWVVLGGRTIASQAGTATTNGRYARSLYSGKLGVAPVPSVKVNANYFVSSDEVGSLSADPQSPNFRGPSLIAQKNSGYGLDLGWEPVSRLKFVLAYQKNAFWANSGGRPANDAATRFEINWERKLFKIRTYYQRAGVNFVAFGNPGIIGDRITYDLQLGVYPAAWYSLNLGANQYRDNLANDPNKTTTTQQILTMSHSLQMPTATSLGVNASLNTAQGKPRTVLDNQTTTIGVSLGQLIKKHSVSLNVQSSQFRDKNRLAHNLDTQTVGFSSSWKLPRRWGATLGATQSETKDKNDGSKRTSQSFGPGLSVPLSAAWSGQFWGTYTATKNTSPSLPADSTLMSANSEYTWSCSKQVNITFGLGGNVNKDKIASANTYKELTASLRYSYTF